ncbi:hypothetical protein CR513_46924, partial [Mucuna pruriens]
MGYWKIGVIIAQPLSNAIIKCDYWAPESSGSESRFGQMLGSEEHNLSSSSSLEHIFVSSGLVALVAIPESTAAVEVTSSYGVTPTALVKHFHVQEHFEWVSEEVRDYKSFLSRSNVANFAKIVMWMIGEVTDQYAMVHCSAEERVYHLAKDGEADFIYMYDTLMKDLQITLPFDTYEVDVLRTLGVAPT